MKEIFEKTFRALGLTKNYKSYRRTAAAVWLAIEKEERLEAVTKEIYPEVARACGCSWMAVERSLRTSV
ncbi:MAG: sporulation initiation factor Spo0A C-terminal domain-containing protein, partial [Butyricicoccaceae bacterium]